MSDIFRIGANVATPLGLLGFVAAAAFYLLLRLLRHQERQLTQLPPEERAKAVDHFLTRYKLSAENLTRDQKYALILAEMEKRYKLTRLIVIVSASTFVISLLIGIAAHTFAASSVGPKPMSPVQPPPTVEKFAVSSGSAFVPDPAHQHVFLQKDRKPGASLKLRVGLANHSDDVCYLKKLTASLTSYQSF